MISKIKNREYFNFVKCQTEEFLEIVKIIITCTQAEISHLRHCSSEAGLLPRRIFQQPT